MISKKKSVKVTEKSLEEFLVCRSIGNGEIESEPQSVLSQASPGPMSVASCSPSKAS